MEVARGPNSAPLWPSSCSRAWGVRCIWGAGRGCNRVWIQVCLGWSFCSYQMVLIGPHWRGYNRVNVRHKGLRRPGDAAFWQTYVTWTVEVKVEQQGAGRICRRGFTFLALLASRPALLRLRKKRWTRHCQICIVTNTCNISVFGRLTQSKNTTYKFRQKSFYPC